MSEIIMYDDADVTHRTDIEGWIDKDGIYCGPGENGEKLARYRSCTHTTCMKCGKPAKKGYTACPECREKSAQERWEKAEKRPWDGTTMVWSDTFDEFFSSLEELSDWLEYNYDEEDPEHNSENIDERRDRLYHCVPVMMREVDPDDLIDVGLDEECSVPAAVERAVEELNKLIRKQEPLGWEPSNIAVEPAKGGNAP